LELSGKGEGLHVWIMLSRVNGSVLIWLGERGCEGQNLG
jgi:hypothetical protein